jgi:hypothetical protein
MQGLECGILKVEFRINECFEDVLFRSEFLFLNLEGGAGIITLGVSAKSYFAFRMKTQSCMPVPVFIISFFMKL